MVVGGHVSAVESNCAHTDFPLAECIQCSHCSDDMLNMAWHASGCTLHHCQLRSSNVLLLNRGALHSRLTICPAKSKPQSRIRHQWQCNTVRRMCMLPTPTSTGTTCRPHGCRASMLTPIRTLLPDMEQKEAAGALQAVVRRPDIQDQCSRIYSIASHSEV